MYIILKNAKQRIHHNDETWTGEYLPEKEDPWPQELETPCLAAPYLHLLQKSLQLYLSNWWKVVFFQMTFFKFDAAMNLLSLISFISNSRLPTHARLGENLTRLFGDLFEGHVNQYHTLQPALQHLLKTLFKARDRHRSWATNLNNWLVKY